MRTELEMALLEVNITEADTTGLAKCCAVASAFVDAATAELARRAEFGVAEGDTVYVKILAKVTEVRYATGAVVVLLDEDEDGDDGMLYTVSSDAISPLVEAVEETPPTD